jgi:hypothetical protein
VPDSYYCEQLGKVAARIEEEGYPDLYHAAIAEFAPFVIQAAQQPELDLELDGSEEDDEDRHYIDHMLAVVTLNLYKDAPELATTAHDLIVTDYEKKTCDALLADRLLGDAFLESRFADAQTLLADENLSLIQSPWEPMAERLAADTSAEAWGNDVLATILTAKPDYFSSYGNYYESATDFLLGRNVGEVLGLLGRTDIMQSIIVRREHAYTDAQTVAGMADGLGARGNQEGLAQLIRAVKHYDAETQVAVLGVFDSAREQSSGEK